MTLKPHLTSKFGMTRNLIVLDAVIAWRDMVLQKNIFRQSKINYLANMVKLIQGEIFDIEQPLLEFFKIKPKEIAKLIESISDWSPSTKKSRRDVFCSFYRFSTQNEITKSIIPFEEYRDPKKVAISELISSNMDKANLHRLTVDDILCFMLEMCNLNPRDSLVCWMMWEYKLTIHETLKLQINDIDFSEKRLKIRDKDEYRLGTIRPDLKECILVQSKGKSDSDLLFTTGRGKHLSPGQIVRNMKIASQRAKLPIIISPKILYADAVAYGKMAYCAMSEDERNRLSMEFSKQHDQLMKKGNFVFEKKA